MKRFLILNFTDSFNLLVETMIKENNFFQVENHIIRNDVIIIDTYNKCWCYGENGSTLVNNYFLSKFENYGKLSGATEFLSLAEIIKLAEKLD